MLASEMKLMLTRLYGENYTILRMCQAYNIIIIMRPLDQLRGVWFDNADRPVILINSDLVQKERALTFWHELYHYLYRRGVFLRVYPDRLTVEEKEKNAIAFALLVCEPSRLLREEEVPAIIAQHPLAEMQEMFETIRYSVIPQLFPVKNTPVSVATPELTPELK